ncbi:MAG: EAL domain-containing protein [Variovorax sp.]
MSDLSWSLPHCVSAPFSTLSYQPHYSARTSQVKVDGSLLLHRDLPYALARDQFHLVYQPQIDIRTDQIVGVEALLRWNHPLLGLVSPGVFIPLAEKTGLIMQLGDWVLRAACAQYRTWHAAGCRQTKISVNVSARQLAAPGIASRMRMIVEEMGVPPESIDLEITESALIQDIGRCRSIMRELKDVGFTLSIDDFGTGYSNLSYLGELPFDTLKIDRAFVRPLDGAGRDSVRFLLAQAIVRMAHALKMEVVAEGVETERQLASLTEMHCDRIQGFLYSPAIEPEEMGKLLRCDDAAPALRRRSAETFSLDSLAAP